MSIIDLGRIDGQDLKAIVTIPGWQSENIWKKPERGSPDSLAKMYAASAWSYACITLRADAIAMIEWEIVPDSNEDAPLQPRHPLVELLNEVNPELNWNDLIRAAETDLDIYGRAYWLKERSGSRRPGGLFRLNPAFMEMIADSSGIEGWKLHLSGEPPRIYAREDVIYFREYDPTNDLGGLSKLSVAMAAASAGVNTAEYVATFFENYAIPPLVFSTEQSMDVEEVSKLRDTWNRWFRGKKKQHKTGWTTHGMKPNVIGYPTKDLAMKDLAEELRRDICAVFRVPPSLAGAWEAANYATADAQLRFLYNNTLKPRCEYMSGVLEAELFEEFLPGLKLKWRFDKLDVMAEDKLTEAERHSMLVRAGIEDRLAAAESLEVEPAAEPPRREFPVFAQEQNGRGDLVQELRQWERFAHNRMKRGQESREFRTEHIPLTLKRSIEGQLEAAQDPRDVTEILRAAEVWKAYP
jgi:HK97 family phage portal protein